LVWSSLLDISFDISAFSLSRLLPPNCAAASFLIYFADASLPLCCDFFASRVLWPFLNLAISSYRFASSYVKSYTKYKKLKQIPLSDMQSLTLREIFSLRLNSDRIFSMACNAVPSLPYFTINLSLILLIISYFRLPVTDAAYDDCDCDSCRLLLTFLGPVPPAPWPASFAAYLISSSCLNLSYFLGIYNY